MNCCALHEPLVHDLNFAGIGKIAAASPGHDPKLRWLIELTTDFHDDRIVAVVHVDLTIPKAARSPNDADRRDDETEGAEPMMMMMTAQSSRSEQANECDARLNSLRKVARFSRCEAGLNCSPPENFRTRGNPE